MIQVVKEGGAFGRKFIEQLKLRSEASNQKVEAAVAEILANVRENGDSAVKEYTCLLYTSS